MTIPFDRRAIPAGAVESRWTAADGHPIRRIDWPAPAATKGSILFLPGRGDFYEKYLETLDHWAGQGWQVTAADWRGQAGSGRLGQDAVTGHIDDFATWVADLAGLWSAWKAQTPGPHVLAGHSMGGHLVLRAAAEGVVDPQGLLLSAPMLGFVASLLPVPVMHAAARLVKALGDPRRPAWKWSEAPGQVPDGRADLLTHDPDRYADELWWRDHRPELVMGPGSWGWVERAYASMRLLARPDMLARVTQPVLILATDNDKLVGYGAIERAARYLPDVERISYGKASHHEILREADVVRDAALAAGDTFLARIAG
ncbi:alpha/beta fold hydrolase [Novosphingobium sp. B 225]|uniref:alpha/beta fold hydrolase n=1 Tax=Novosphingobium sp. B 225 TaxID=1961849 RepID=UPI0020CD11D1|nr:alpha/beta hydrolase [Novosphingobium sp. B 225]